MAQARIGESEEERLARSSGLPASAAEHDSMRRAASERTPFDHLRLPERFQARHMLGRGGMGSVYCVYDRDAGHDVALKVLHGISAEDRLRLKREFRALRTVIHPNLVHLYELVSDEWSCFFTMELVRGKPLRAYLAAQEERAGNREGYLLALQSVAQQLALALTALHLGGKVHRDVKPSNVLVTDAGRVVLVDFGLASSTTTASAQDDFGGTLLYMAPEQIFENKISPASDWYAFGVTLYEVIADKLPVRFELTSAGLNKRSPALRDLGIVVPDELDELIQRLLAVDPGLRPASDEILSVLGGSSPQLNAPYSLVPQATPELIGRETLLAQLRTALSSENDDQRLVCVAGPSGIGKSALIDTLFSELSQRPNTLLLKSRCHPQEALAFNAFDGFVDELSSELPGCLNTLERRLRAAHYNALVQLFPVLASSLEVDPLSSEPDARDADQRQLAFAAMRELLRRISQGWQIVAWLDDLQWGDEDSGVLLRELLRARDCAPIRVIVSYRSEDEQVSPCLQVLRADERLWQTRTAFAVGPLDAADSAALLRRDLGWGANEDPALLERLLRYADSSPFFLGELARYVQQAGVQAISEGVGLEQILQTRIAGLPASSRTLLEVLAVAGAPLEQAMTLTAAGLGSVERGLFADLERLSILRTTELGRRRVEFYHARIREEILQGLSAEARQGHHRAIGQALLTAANPNPLSALEHFEAAGDESSVRRYVVAAANHAMRALAFERAARLYQRAIDLAATDLSADELQRRLAVALGSAGYGKESGLAYLAASALLKNDSSTDAEAIVHLRQRAAEQFIQTGHFALGMDALREVMNEMGIRFPKSQAEALRKALSLRLLALAMGVRAKKRSAPANAAELGRFDVLWSTNIRLAMVDYTFTSYASARCAADALKLGDPSRMIRALGLESTNWSLLPGAAFQKHAQRLTALAEQMHAQQPTPYDRAFLLAAGAVAACFRGEFQRVVADADGAIATLRAATSGRQWEEGLWEMWSMIGLTHLGELKKLVERAAALREDARQRDDRFIALNTNLGRPATTWLVSNQAEVAIVEADRALGWSMAGYTTQHYQHYVSTSEARLYLGTPEPAWQKTLETWKAHKKNAFLSIRFVRDELLHTRARSAIALAIHPSGGSKADRERLRKDATSAAKNMAEHGLEPARGWSLLVRAALDHQQQDDRSALSRLEQAVALFDDCKMQLYREAARYRLGQLTGLENGQKMAEQAKAWVTAQGAENAEAMFGMLAPGFTS